MTGLWLAVGCWTFWICTYWFHILFLKIPGLSSWRENHHSLQNCRHCYLSQQRILHLLQPPFLDQCRFYAHFSLDWWESPVVLAPHTHFQALENENMKVWALSHYLSHMNLLLILHSWHWMNSYHHTVRFCYWTGQYRAKVSVMEWKQKLRPAVPLLPVLLHNL